MKTFFEIRDAKTKVIFTKGSYTLIAIVHR